MSVCLKQVERVKRAEGGEEEREGHKGRLAVTIWFGPRLIEKRVENCIGQQRGNVLGQPAKYSLGLIKHDQPQAADNGMNRQTMHKLPSAQCCRGHGVAKGIGDGVRGRVRARVRVEIGVGVEFSVGIE